MAALVLSAGQDKLKVSVGVEDAVEMKGPLRTSPLKAINEASGNSDDLINQTEKSAMTKNKVEVSE